MRIILSRKGMDSGAGGMASPILPDGTLLSLPIPENEDVKDADSTYDDIEYKGIKYSKIVRDLEEGERDKENLVKKPECTKCHIDPDLINRYSDFPSREGWKAAFGQHGKWQKHLEDYGIGKGDIFLFYGWFRLTKYENGKLRFTDDGKRAINGKHIIWGYMQVDEIIPKDRILSEYPHHPHGKDVFMNEEHNVLYVPNNDKLSFDTLNKPAYGIMRYDVDLDFEKKHDLDLTKEGCSRSKWDLPRELENVEITCHTEKLGFNGRSYFQSAPQGQEFIINTDVRPGTELYNWLKKILSYAPNK